LPKLQSEGFIEEPADSNLKGAFYRLTDSGQLALISAGVKLV